MLHQNVPPRSEALPLPPLQKKPCTLIAWPWQLVRLVREFGIEVVPGASKESSLGLERFILVKVRELHPLHLRQCCHKTLTCHSACCCFPRMISMRRHRLPHCLFPYDFFECIIAFLLMGERGLCVCRQGLSRTCTNGWQKIGCPRAKLRRR